MRSLHINSILKSLKIATVLFLIFPKINAFGAVSGFVDSKQVNQNIPMAIAFNPSGTKNVCCWNESK